MASFSSCAGVTGDGAVNDGEFSVALRCVCVCVFACINHLWAICMSARWQVANTGRYVCIGNDNF